MKKVLLASHGRMAEGLKDTLQIFMGDCSGVKAVCAYVEEGCSFLNELESFIDENENDGETIIFTDIYGGSVNNKITEIMLTKQKDIPVVAGMNLPLVLALCLSVEPYTKGMIEKAFEECRYVLMDFDSLNTGEGEDAFFKGTESAEDRAYIN